MPHRYNAIPDEAFHEKNEFLSWKNEHDQTDDVLIMGFRI
jgi:hypothetical protein